MKNLLRVLIFSLALAACSPVQAGVSPSQTVVPSSTVLALTPVESETPIPTTFPPATTTSAVQPGVTEKIPNFEHIILIVLENEDYKGIIGSSKMPYLNSIANQYVLLTNYYALTHPSLPNYIGLVSGSTHQIDSNCTDCFLNQPNLADRIEAGGKTWKTYQEDMPSPCFVGNAEPYVQKHNPFIYFDSIRLNETRCKQSVVPLTQLEGDLASNQLPNFAFIMPNLCNSGHDCSFDKVDHWLNKTITKLQASPALGSNSLIIVTFDEGDSDSTQSCCGMGKKAGGQIATVLISSQARENFQDNTAYSHYSMLKTILAAWNLPALGQDGNETTPLIEAPWKKELASDPAKPSPAATKTTLPPQKMPTQTGESDSTFPIRAAFYYPWFPESWKQKGLEHFSQYNPTLGFYSQDDPAIIQQHIAAMQYGKIQAGIFSWWGKDQPTDQRVATLLQAGEAADFSWAVYFEEEGYGDPAADSIRSSLEYIRDQYAASPAYLKIDGRMVVFVYADKNDRCNMADRWTQANKVGAYLVLKVFSGYRTCSSQPDAWHQYAPDISLKQVGKNSVSISPGFWLADDQSPRLERDLARWNQDVQAMTASDSKFHLITTFNEWGEGSSVESAAGWESASGYGLYLDALHNDGLSP